MKLITIDGEAELIKQFDAATGNQYPGTDLSAIIHSLEEAAELGEPLTAEINLGDARAKLTLTAEHFADYNEATLESES